MKPLNIREPFYSAGQKYGWIGQGIGISHDTLRDNELIRITIGKEKAVYSISRDKAVRQIKQYNSVEWHKGKKIGVIPLSAFDQEDKTTLF